MGMRGAPGAHTTATVTLAVTPPIRGGLRPPPPPLQLAVCVLRRRRRGEGGHGNHGHNDRHVHHGHHERHNHHGHSDPCSCCPGTHTPAVPPIGGGGGRGHHSLCRWCDRCWPPGLGLWRARSLGAACHLPSGGRCQGDGVAFSLVRQSCAPHLRGEPDRCGVAPTPRAGVARLLAGGGPT